jgi:proteic killer suppression protein
MIRSFACARTQRLFNREQVPEFANIESVARRRLLALNNAVVISDLRIPPGNRLEALSGGAGRRVEHPSQRSVSNLFYMDGVWSPCRRNH